jgi:dsRNA-specific ribonuclease
MAKLRVAREICDKVESYTMNSPYFVVDGCAGIGGNTLEFLNRKKCATVMSFEREKDRALMLQRNIMGYNFGDKSIVVNAELTGEEDFEAYRDAIFYFDPPWLPPVVPDNINYKQYYIRKGMKVGKFTLEEWLEKLKDTAYIVVLRVPDNYELGDVNGWTYHTENVGREGSREKATGEDGKLYFCFPNRKIKGSNSDVFGGYVKELTAFRMKLDKIDTSLAKRYENAKARCAKKSMEAAKKDSDCLIFVKYSFVDPDPLETTGAIKPVKLTEPVTKETTPASPKPADGVRRTYDGRPILPLDEQVWKFKDMPIPAKGIDLDSAEWVAEFQAYLSIVLKKFLKNKEGKPSEVVDDLIGNDDSMSIWIRAFTHETYRPDPTENYENLEFIGDRCFEYTFSFYIRDYLAKYVTDIEALDQKNIITQYKKKYMSNTFQSYVAEGLGMDKWTRRSGLKYQDKSISEDVMEAFCGALHEAGERVKPNLGIVLVRKFVNFIGVKITLDPEIIQGDTPSFVVQFFESAVQQGQVQPVEYLGSPGNYTASISVGAKSVQFLRSLGISIDDSGIIGIGKGTSKEDAKTAAYEAAAVFLRDNNLTKEYAKTYKQEKRWDDIKEKNPMLYKKIKTILDRNSIDTDDILFTAPITDKVKGGKVLLQMIYIKDEKKTVLAEGVGDTPFDAKIAAVNNYISKMY